jgi:predicted O-methyltransferase YrrM
MVVIPDRTKYPKTKNPWENKALFVNDVIAKIYNSGKLYSGEKLTAGINAEEGYFMYDLIKQNKFKHCLEIGMANGMSALYMCQALKENDNGGTLISIDPFQTTQWKQEGVNNIKRAGLVEYSALLEEMDYLALPEILANMKANKVPKFDLIFIDGDHRFDYTLLDFLYSDLLLNVGGVILVDDIRHRSVKPVINYLDTNYTHFTMLKGPKASDTMACFIKKKQDERAWNFHINFKG